MLAGLCLALSGCEDDDFIGNTKVGRVDECHVAVVLPFSDGLEAHWKQCLKLCSDNLYKASLQNGSGVRLVYDFYDEESPNLTDLAKSLAADEGITAVIGGFYSSNAITLANVFSKANKPFFTIATTEQLVRAYSSWGNLWAMTIGTFKDALSKYHGCWDAVTTHLLTGYILVTLYVLLVL